MRSYGIGKTYILYERSHYYQYIILYRLLCATFPCSICSKESKLWITSNKRNKNKLYIVNDYKHGDDDNNNDNYDNQYCVNIMRREFNIREQHHRVRVIIIIVIIIISFS